MGTPIIHRISDRAPEFPCWLYDPVMKQWYYWPKSVNIEVSTHWTHSDTRPEVVPEQDKKPTYQHGSVELEEAPPIDLSQRLTPAVPSPELPAEVREDFETRLAFAIHEATTMTIRDCRKLAAALAPLWAKQAQDTARLDWLERYPGDGLLNDWPNGQGWCVPGSCTGYYKTARKAIDAAMKETTK